MCFEWFWGPVFTLSFPWKTMMVIFRIPGALTRFLFHSIKTVPSWIFYIFLCILAMPFLIVLTLVSIPIGLLFDVVALVLWCVTIGYFLKRVKPHYFKPALRSVCVDCHYKHERLKCSSRQQIFCGQGCFAQCSTIDDQV